jgi:PucR C-terminal helix-turn-helix domain
MDRPWSGVPTWVGAALRPELTDAIDEIIAVVRAEVPDYARPLTGRFGSRITEGVTVAIEQFLDLLGHDVPLGDVGVYRALGRLEHREGRTLAALQAAYQVGTRTLWRRVADGPTARQLPAEVIFRLAEALFSYIEQVSAASVAGWADEEASRAGSLQARRQALVELLAGTPPATPAEVERLATSTGWTLPARLAALVVPDAVPLAARLPGAVGADLEPAGLVMVPVRGDESEWLDRIRTGLGDRHGVLGPVVERAHAHRSAAMARAAWPLHVAGQLSPGAALVRADEHLVALLLVGEPDLTAALCERALAPLRALPAGAAARAEETLRAWLDAHGDVTAAAAVLHVHPQTVRYRLAGLRDVLGGALDDPTARLELALALRVPPSRPAQA